MDLYTNVQVLCKYISQLSRNDAGRTGSPIALQPSRRRRYLIFLTLPHNSIPTGCNPPPTRVSCARAELRLPTTRSKMTPHSMKETESHTHGGDLFYSRVISFEQKLQMLWIIYFCQFSTEMLYIFGGITAMTAAITTCSHRCSYWHTKDEIIAPQDLTGVVRPAEGYSFRALLSPDNKRRDKN